MLFCCASLTPPDPLCRAHPFSTTVDAVEYVDFLKALFDEIAIEDMPPHYLWRSDNELHHVDLEEKLAHAHQQQHEHAPMAQASPHSSHSASQCTHSPRHSCTLLAGLTQCTHSPRHSCTLLAGLTQ
jgi:hypothetical protein